MSEAAVAAPDRAVAASQPVRRWLVPLFAITSFLSAFLLFLVQPMYAKLLLPQLGGSPSVWNTALVFYQAALLGGYLWAHASGRLGTRRHAAGHIALFFVAMLLLPIGGSRLGPAPVDSNPIPWLLGAMTLGVGLPFFVVSAGAPLLQKWFSESGHPRASDPYFLYAASNVGSMLALIGYPLLLEPELTLGSQRALWAVGFVVLAVAMAGCAWAVRGRSAASFVTQAPADARPAWPRRMRWVALAFVPSALMMGVTTYLTTDVASVPLLWVAPLALYLLTFILVFARVQLVPHRWLAWALAPMLVAMLLVVLIPVTKPAVGLAALGVGTFFLACWVCHGELAADRPSSAHLTEFYLWMSVGGVLGGAFCALVAPVVFNTVLEYSIAMALCAALLPLGTTRKTTPVTYGLDVFWVCALVVALFFLVPFEATERFKALSSLPFSDTWIDRFFSYGIAGLIALALIRRPVRFGLACGAILVMGTLMNPGRARTLLEERSFFGVLRVQDTERGSFRNLYHGTTLHGFQHLDEAYRDVATSYYHRTGPIGLTVNDMQKRYPALRVAAVGLGTGTLATYGRAGEEWDYYEIDPAVIRIARDPRYYTFISDSKASFRFILGDARLALARQERQYDLLVLDAYSSDAVPLHLLTREALQVYLRRLAPGGVIAFHISNRHLDFEPVVDALCEDAGLVARINSDGVFSFEDSAEGKYASEWVVAARQTGDLGAMATDDRWKPLKPNPKLRLWTDDYTNLLTILEL